MGRWWRVVASIFSSTESRAGCPGERVTPERERRCHRRKGAEVEAEEEEEEEGGRRSVDPSTLDFVCSLGP